MTSEASVELYFNPQTYKQIHIPTVVQGGMFSFLQNKSILHRVDNLELALQDATFFGFGSSILDFTFFVRKC